MWKKKKSNKSSLTRKSILANHLIVFLECLVPGGWEAHQSRDSDMEGAALPLPHIRPKTRAGVHSPRPIARFQRAPGRGQTADPERTRGSLGEQEREPARHLSRKEGIPFPSNGQACGICACQQGQCQLKFIWKHCVLLLRTSSWCTLFWKLGRSYFPNL